MASLQLYSYFRSSTAYRVRIALHYKAIDFEYLPVHLLNNGGEQHSPQYRALNATGGVPTLVHNGRALGQSRAILEYLEALVPQPALIPKDPFQKALMSQICDNINCEMHPLGNLRVTQYLEKQFSQDESARQNWILHWHRLGWSATEKLLQTTAGQFAVGDSLTLADLFLVPQAFTSERFGLTLDQWPICHRIITTCRALEAFQLAHPFSQIDTPKDLRQPRADSTK